MIKEKRYELYKRGELDDRNPQGIDALSEDSGSPRDLLSDRSRGETPSPRSSLRSQMINDRENKKAPGQRTDAAPPYQLPGEKGLPKTKRKT